MLFPAGTFLDPGHLAVKEYVPSLDTNIVTNHAVDGVHFDHIRSPETEGASRRDSAVGYNPAALARFRKAAGRTDTPAPGDEAFWNGGAGR